MRIFLIFFLFAINLSGQYAYLNTGINMKNLLEL